MLLHVPRISFVHARLFSGLGAAIHLPPFFTAPHTYCCMCARRCSHEIYNVCNSGYTAAARAHLFTRQYLKDYLSIDHQPAGNIDNAILQILTRCRPILHIILRSAEKHRIIFKIILMFYNGTRRVKISFRLYSICQKMMLIFLAKQK